MATDTEYDKKYKELQQYIPFLEGMIHKLEKTDNQTGPSREAQLNKIKALHSLIVNKGPKRMKMENLLKCEEVLLKLHSKVSKKEPVSNRELNPKQQVTDKDTKQCLTDNKLLTKNTQEHAKPASFSNKQESPVMKSVVCTVPSTPNKSKGEYITKNVQLNFYTETTNKETKKDTIDIPSNDNKLFFEKSRAKLNTVCENLTDENSEFDILSKNSSLAKSRREYTRVLKSPEVDLHFTKVTHDSPKSKVVPKKSPEDKLYYRRSPKEKRKSRSHSPRHKYHKDRKSKSMSPKQSGSRDPYKNEHKSTPKTPSKSNTRKHDPRKNSDHSKSKSHRQSGKSSNKVRNLGIEQLSKMIKNQSCKRGGLDFLKSIRDQLVNELLVEEVCDMAMSQNKDNPNNNAEKEDGEIIESDDNTDIYENIFTDTDTTDNTSSSKNTSELSNESTDTTPLKVFKQFIKLNMIEKQNSVNSSAKPSTSNPASETNKADIVGLLDSILFSVNEKLNEVNKDDRTSDLKKFVKNVEMLDDWNEEHENFPSTSNTLTDSSKSVSTSKLLDDSRDKIVRHTDATKALENTNKLNLINLQETVTCLDSSIDINISNKKTNLKQEVSVKLDRSNECITVNQNKKLCDLTLQNENNITELESMEISKNTQISSGHDFGVKNVTSVGKHFSIEKKDNIAGSTINDKGFLDLDPARRIMKLASCALKKPESTPFENQVKNTVTAPNFEEDILTALNQETQGIVLDNKNIQKIISSNNVQPENIDSKNRDSKVATEKCTSRTRRISFEKYKETAATSRGLTPKELQRFNIKSADSESKITQKFYDNPGIAVDKKISLRPERTVDVSQSLKTGYHSPNESNEPLKAVYHSPKESNDSGKNSSIRLNSMNDLYGLVKNVPAVSSPLLNMPLLQPNMNSTPVGILPGNIPFLSPSHVLVSPPQTSVQLPFSQSIQNIQDPNINSYINNIANINSMPFGQQSPLFQQFFQANQSFSSNVLPGPLFSPTSINRPASNLSATCSDESLRINHYTETNFESGANNRGHCPDKQNIENQYLHLTDKFNVDFPVSANYKGRNPKPVLGYTKVPNREQVEVQNNERKITNKEMLSPEYSNQSMLDFDRRKHQNEHPHNTSSLSKFNQNHQNNDSFSSSLRQHDPDVEFISFTPSSCNVEKNSLCFGDQIFSRESVVRHTVTRQIDRRFERAKSVCGREQDPNDEFVRFVPNSCSNEANSLRYNDQRFRRESSIGRAVSQHTEGRFQRAKSVGRNFERSSNRIDNHAVSDLMINRNMVRAPSVGRMTSFEDNLRSNWYKNDYASTMDFNGLQCGGYRDLRNDVFQPSFEGNFSSRRNNFKRAQSVGRLPDRSSAERFNVERNIDYQMMNQVRQRESNNENLSWSGSQNNATDKSYNNDTWIYQRENESSSRMVHPRSMSQSQSLSGNFSRCTSVSRDPRLKNREILENPNIKRSDNNKNEYNRESSRERKSALERESKYSFNRGRSQDRRSGSENILGKGFNKDIRSERKSGSERSRSRHRESMSKMNYSKKELEKGMESSSRSGIYSFKIPKIKRTDTDNGRKDREKSSSEHKETKHYSENDNDKSRKSVSTSNKHSREKDKNIDTKGIKSDYKNSTDNKNNKHHRKERDTKQEHLRNIDNDNFKDQSHSTHGKKFEKKSDQTLKSDNKSHLNEGNPKKEKLKHKSSASDKSHDSKLSRKNIKDDKVHNVEIEKENLDNAREVKKQTVKDIEIDNVDKENKSEDGAKVIKVTIDGKIPDGNNLSYTNQSQNIQSPGDLLNIEKIQFNTKKIELDKPALNSESKDYVDHHISESSLEKEKTSNVEEKNGPKIDLSGNSLSKDFVIETNNVVLNADANSNDCASGTNISSNEEPTLKVDSVSVSNTQEANVSSSLSVSTFTNKGQDSMINASNECVENSINVTQRNNITNLKISVEPKSDLSLVETSNTISTISTNKEINDSPVTSSSVNTEPTLKVNESNVLSQVQLSEPSLPKVDNDLNSSTDVTQSLIDSTNVISDTKVSSDSQKISTNVVANDSLMQEHDNVNKKVLSDMSSFPEDVKITNLSDSGSVGSTNVNSTEPLSVSSFCPEMSNKDDVSNLLSLLNDKSKIIEMLTLLEKSDESGKIRKKLQKLAEIESDEENEERIVSTSQEDTKSEEHICENIISTQCNNIDNKNTLGELDSAAEESVTTSAEVKVLPQRKTKKVVKGKACTLTTKKIVQKKNNLKKKFVPKKQQKSAQRKTRSASKIITSTLTTTPDLKKPKVSRELQALQEDIRDMFISQGVLNLNPSGIRMCRVAKDTRLQDFIPSTDSPDVKVNKNVKQKSSNGEHVSFPKKNLVESKAKVNKEVNQKLELNVPNNIKRVRGKNKKATKEVKKLNQDVEKQSNTINDLNEKQNKDNNNVQERMPCIILRKSDFPAGWVSLNKKVTDCYEFDSDNSEPLPEPRFSKRQLRKRSSIHEEKLSNHVETNELVLSTTENQFDSFIDDDLLITVKPGPKSRKKMLLAKTTQVLNKDMNTAPMDSQNDKSESNIGDGESSIRSILQEEITSEDESLLSFKSMNSAEYNKNTKPKKKKRCKWSAGVFKKSKKKSKSTESADFESIEEIKSQSPNSSDDTLPNELFIEQSHCFTEGDLFYRCQICSFTGKNIVSHHKQNHPHFEFLMSRLDPTSAKEAISQAQEIQLEHQNCENNRKESFKCRFCKRLFDHISIDIFYQHILQSHTGEFEEKCSMCQNSKDGNNICNFSNSVFYPVPPKTNDYMLFGYICLLCNYTQLDKNNILNHITKRHKTDNHQVLKINLCMLPLSNENISHINNTSCKASVPGNIQADDNITHKIVSNFNKSRSISITDSINTKIRTNVPEEDNAVGDKTVRDATDDWPEEEYVRPKSCAFALISEPNQNQNSMIKVKTEPGLSSTSDMSDATTERKLAKGFPLYMSDLRVRMKDDDSIEYTCFIKGCILSFLNISLFLQHLKIKHSNDTWNGICSECRKNVTEDKAPSYDLALEHLVKDHIENRKELLQELKKADEKRPVEKRSLIKVRPIADLMSFPQEIEENDAINSSQEDSSGDDGFPCIRIESVISLSNVDDTPIAPPPADNQKVVVIKKQSLNNIEQISLNSLSPSHAMPPLLYTSSIGGKCKNEVLLDSILSSYKMAHLFICAEDTCNYTSNSPDKFVKHIENHSKSSDENRKYASCIYCGFIEVQAQNLMTHILSEHGHCRYLCNYCIFRAAAPILVKYHQDVAHKGMEIKVYSVSPHPDARTEADTPTQTVREYICKQGNCLKEFVTRDHFMDHLRKDHGKCSAFHCHICMVMCLRPVFLVSHYKNHMYCLYQCTYCEYGSETELEMTHHMMQKHTWKAPQAYIRHIIKSKAKQLDVSVPVIKLDKPEHYEFVTELECPAGNDLTEEIDPLEENQSPQMLTDSQSTRISDTSSNIEENSNRMLEIRPVVMNLGVKSTTVNQIMVTTLDGTQLTIAGNNASLATQRLSPDVSPKNKSNTPPISPILRITSPKVLRQVSKADILGLRSNLIKIAPKQLPTLVLVPVESGLSNIQQCNTSIDGVNSDDLDSKIEFSDSEKQENISQKQLENVEDGVIVLDSDDDNATPLKTKPSLRNKRLQSSNKPVAVISLSDDDTDFGNSGASSSDLLVPTENSIPFNLQDHHTDLSKKKLTLQGSELYRCGNKMCGVSCPTMADFKIHVFNCKSDGSISCYHCKRYFKNTVGLFVHLVTHGLERWRCGLCDFKKDRKGSVVTHLKSVHKSTSFTTVPLDVRKQDELEDIFILKPDSSNYTEEVKTKSPKESPLKILSKPADPAKRKYSPDEIDLLPLNPIWENELYCSKCSFSTKVRSNMVRHLMLHAVETFPSVPSVAPVNPVPHLETNEKHFDKMSNLALSSNMDRVNDGALTKDKNELKNVIDKEKYPKYITTKARFVCGATGCSYISVDETMLKYHWEALHSTESSYKCAHCPPNQQMNNDRPLTANRIVFHLRMHDSRLYNCIHCSYYHYQKHLVERHLMDKHPNLTRKVGIIREIDDTENTSTDEVPRPSISAMDIRPWQCGLCTFKFMLKGEAIKHSDKVHNMKSQFKCSLCNFITNSNLAINNHFDIQHNDQNKDITVAYYQDDPQSNVPLWWKQRKRPSQFTDDSANTQQAATERNPPEPQKPKQKMPEKTSTQANKKIKLTKEVPVEQNDKKVKEPIKPSIVAKLNKMFQTEKSLHDTLNQIKIINVKTESVEAVCVEQENKIVENTSGSSSSVMQNQQETDENDVNEERLYFKCSLCPSSFLGITTFREHLYEEFDYPRWSCSWCRASLYTEAQAQEHTKREHMRKNYNLKKLPSDENKEYLVETVVKSVRECGLGDHPQVNENPMFLMASSENESILPDVPEIVDVGSHVQAHVSKYFQSRSSPLTLGSWSLEEERRLARLFGSYGTPLGLKYACSLCRFLTVFKVAMENHLCLEAKCERFKCSMCPARFYNDQLASIHFLTVHKNCTPTLEDLPDEVWKSSDSWKWVQIVLDKQRALMPKADDAPVMTDSSETSNTAAPSSTKRSAEAPKEETVAKKRRMKNTYYACDKCPFTTVLRPSYNKHMQRHEELQYSCKYCKFSGSTPSEVENHCRERHGNKLICYVTTDLDQDRIGSANVFCFLCQVIIQRSAIVRHIESHHREMNIHITNKNNILFKCMECSSVLSDFVLVVRHFNERHQGSNLQIKITKMETAGLLFRCHECMTVFKFRFDLDLHRDQMHGRYHNNLSKIREQIKDVGQQSAQGKSAAHVLSPSWNGEINFYLLWGDSSVENSSNVVDLNVNFGTVDT